MFRNYLPWVLCHVRCRTVSVWPTLTKGVSCCLDARRKHQLVVILSIDWFSYVQIVGRHGTHPSWSPMRVSTHGHSRTCYQIMVIKARIKSWSFMNVPNLGHSWTHKIMVSHERIKLWSLMKVSNHSRSWTYQIMVINASVKSWSFVNVSNHGY